MTRKRFVKIFELRLFEKPHYILVRSLHLYLSAGYRLVVMSQQWSNEKKTASHPELYIITDDFFGIFTEKICIKQITIKIDN